MTIVGTTSQTVLPCHRRTNVSRKNSGRANYKNSRHGRPVYTAAIAPLSRTDIHAFLRITQHQILNVSIF